MESCPVTSRWKDDSTIVLDVQLPSTDAVLSAAAMAASLKTHGGETYFPLG